MYLHQNKGDFLLVLDAIYYSHSIVEGGFDEIS
jgi:hypothetical protein